MNPVVIYSTKGGSTEKVALVITHELNCKAIKISGDSTISFKDFDLVLLGPGFAAGSQVRNCSVS